MSTKELTIDPELRDLLPPLTADELQGLEDSIVEEGRALVPIFTWANHEDTIIDGMNRYNICRKHDLPFEIKPLKLATKADVIAWIIKHQASRRNLTETQKRELLGKLYNETKKANGRPKNDGNLVTGDEVFSPEKTSTKVASDQGISERSVERAGRLSADLQTLPADAKAAIVTEQVKSSDKAVHDLAALPAKKKEKASKLIAEGKVDSVKEAVEKASGAKPKPATTPKSAHVAKGLQALKALVRALDALKVLELHRTDLNKIESRLGGIK